jgi:hypothetical protein
MLFSLPREKMGEQFRVAVIPFCLVYTNKASPKVTNRNPNRQSWEIKKHQSGRK